MVKKLDAIKIYEICESGNTNRLHATVSRCKTLLPSDHSFCQVSRWKIDSGVEVAELSLPVVNKTTALRQLYSAESTCSAFNFSTCSWKILIWSMKATTLSAAMGDAWRPAAANKGATCNGIEHWDAFKTNSSDHTSRSRATWSVTCNTNRPCRMSSHLSYFQPTVYLLSIWNHACLFARQWYNARWSRP